MFENNAIIILVGIIILVLIIIILRYKFTQFLKSRAQRKRFNRGLSLERKAVKFLKRKGFTIVASQEEYYHRYLIDGKEHKSKLIVDYIVSKDNRKYIVEVKSGQKAILMSNSNTRRQLLEYSFAIKNDGIFLLDMENKEMHLVEFGKDFRGEEDWF
jgi:Holliday junction resolvase